MAKYLMLWEVDSSRLPVDVKERGQMWAMMADMIKQDIKAGVHTDWGSFVGEMRGYTISEGEHLELSKLMQRFVPYVKFEVHQVASIDDIAEIAKSMVE